MVLSTPKNYYIDVRFKLPAPALQIAAETATVYSNTPEQNHEHNSRTAGIESNDLERELRLHYNALYRDQAVASIDDVDWAFAGTFTTSPTSTSGTEVLLRIWTHTIDTLHPDGLFVDQGLLKPHPLFPKDEQITFETGRMINPATGQEQDYEEVWRDWEIQSLEESIEEVRQDQVDGGGRMCCVLQLDTVLTEADGNEDEAKRATKAKGVVIRLGQWCQGLLITSPLSENLSVSSPRTIDIERWYYNRDKYQDQWQCAFKLGTRKLPCEWTFAADGNIQEGNMVREEGLDWQIKEMSTW